ncbi:heterokaryon incompatibility protein-domain-containing protein [Pyrenochaeta sp. MPI-SDFR-AT-0127]|nr:heterokaryon incompatibility protein-domain-containing protein [Pyrenochaeta sp. MPI-SDFR-AT-0127]
MEQVPLLDDPSLCPGSSPPILRTLGHWLLYSIYLIVVIPIPLILFAVVFILFTGTIFPLSFIFAIVAVIYNLVAFCRGTFVPEFEYKPLSDKPDSIRLLEVLPGVGTEPFRCRLIDGQWSTSKYEALSYTWNCEFGRGRRFSIEDRVMGVSPTLSRALAYLRDERCVRTLWIDAVCINQRDIAEKNSQVRQMQEIYQHAQQVVVWLDVDSWAKPAFDSIQVAFDLIKQSLDRSETDKNNVWNSNGPWIETLNMVFRLPYWDRMWIIQEVASNRNVTVQCRHCTLPWESVCRLIALAPSSRYLDFPDGLQEFVQRVENIRDVSSPDPKHGLLAFTHDFRYSMASEPKDRLYALRGLIKSPQNLPNIDVDYAKPAMVLWREFIEDCIHRYGSLNALSLADSQESIWWGNVNPTWLADKFGDFQMFEKRAKLTAVRQPLWLGTTEEGSLYSASGGSKARCRTNLADPNVIGIQGFVYDTVEEVGDIFRVTDLQEKQQGVLRQWKTLSQRQLQNPNSLERLFNETITAGVEANHSNLCQLVRGQPESWLSHELESDRWAEIVSAIHPASNLRRLIATKEHRAIGLAHSQAKPGDLVCILLGSDVPYILRKSKHDETGFSHPFRCWFMGCSRRKHLYCCIPEQYTLVGQAYVHEIMQYQGDVEQDVENASKDWKEFFVE